MRLALRPLPFAFATAVTLAPTLVAGQRAESYSVSGRSVAIYNLAGTVRVERGSGNAVSVEVTRQGRDADRVKVETGAIRGRETLRVRYDGDRIVYPRLGRWNSSTVSVRSDGTWGGDDEDGKRSGWDRLKWGDRVRVSGSGSGIEAWADLVLRVPDGVTVSVHHLAGNVGATGTRADLLLDLGSATADITDHVGALKVDGGSGHATLTNVSGHIDLDLGSGGTDLHGIKASDLKIDAGSGGVTGDDVSVSGQLDVDAGSGRTTFTKLSARRAKMDLGSGGLNAEFVTDVDDLKVDAGSGSVTIYLPPTAGAQVDLESGSGGVSTDFNITVSRMERDRLVGTLGDGKGRITVDAGSGGVRLRKLGSTK
ncbi:MAG: DUF4097 family beta strand repeat protein [Gemmatimonadetes bacterium]|nr:DUF4097 family beta strand repeat protein [Gemmatimonadota bacterium]